MRLFLGFFLALFAVNLQAASSATWPSHRLRGANITVGITEEDIAHFVKDWKGNSVRILINNMLPDEPPYKPGEEKKKKVYDCIDLCLKYGLYTVFSPSAAFRDNDRFFASKQFKAAYLEFWQEVAARYAANPGGIAYDLMNEPHDSLANLQWSDYAKELTRAIREIDTVHTIVVEPPGWGWPYGFDHLEPTGDKNTVYSFHFYGPMDFTHQRNNGILKATEEQCRERVYPGFLQGGHWDKAKIRSSIEKGFNFRDKHNVTIWCGEFGVARWATGAYNWFKDLADILEEEKVGWSYYAYREWYVMDIEMDPKAWMERTSRTETDLVKLVKSYFAR